MCDGKGQYEDFFDDIYGGTHSIGWWECPYCDGTGEINSLKDFKMNLRGKKLLEKMFKGDRIK